MIVGVQRFCFDGEDCGKVATRLKTLRGLRSETGCGRDSFGLPGYIEGPCSCGQAN